MVFRIALGIIFGVLCFGGIAALIAGTVMDGEWDRGAAACKWAGAATALVFAVLFLCIPWSFHTVEAGEISVVKHMGEIEGTRNAGTYFDFWMTDKYEYYDAKVQNTDITTQAYSKDAQTMDIAMTVQFQIQQDKVIDIATQYGNLDALENRIESVVAERTKSVLSKYSAMEIIEKRAEISPEVEQFVKEAIDESYYVDVTTVVLSNIDFSDTFEQTVEDKMVAEQKKLQAEYEKERAIIQAEQELEVARLAAEAAIAKAEGDAQAQLLAAKAEADAIKAKSVEVARMLGFTIKETPVMEENESGELVQVGVNYEIDFEGKTEAEIKVISDYLKYIEYLEAWDGQLPDVMTGEGANVFVPFE